MEWIIALLAFLLLIACNGVLHYADRYHRIREERDALRILLCQEREG